MSTPTPVQTWDAVPDELTRHAESLTRLQIRYLRHHRFRWLALVEILVGLVVMAFCCALLLVALVVLTVLSDGDLDLDFFDGYGLSPRLWTYWQVLELRGIGADDAVCFVARHAPRDAAERDALVRQVLAEARERSLMVVETTQPGETLQRWYGGQPLMSAPEARDRAEAVAVLEAHDWSRLDVEGRVLGRSDAAHSRVWGLASLVFSVLLLPFHLFDWRAGVDGLRSSWWDLTGTPPGAWTIEVGEADLQVGWRRGDIERHSFTFHRTDVLGIAFRPSLGFDRDVSRVPPRLSIVTRDATELLPLRLDPREGRALRDALLCGAISAWEGIPTTQLLPTRCPYCGGLYRFEPGAACPTCGGWPDEVGALMGS